MIADSRTAKLRNGISHPAYKSYNNKTAFTNKNMMKTLCRLFPAVLLLTGLPAMADSFITLEPSEGSASQSHVPLNMETKMKFTPTGVEITNGNEVATYAYGKISKIRFETGTTSITDVTRETSLSLRDNPVTDYLEIDGHDGTPVSLTVTALSGTVLNITDSWKGEGVNVSHLAPGIYLVTINKETLKFIKK